MITKISRTQSNQIIWGYTTGIFDTIEANDFGIESTLRGGLLPYTFPNDGILINLDGTYIITSSVSWAASTVVYVRESAIVVDAETSFAGTVAHSNNTPISTTIPFSQTNCTTVRLFAGDLVQLWVGTPPSGSSLTIPTQNLVNGTANMSLAVALLI